VWGRRVGKISKPENDSKKKNSALQGRNSCWGNFTLPSRGERLDVVTGSLSFIRSVRVFTLLNEGGACEMEKRIGERGPTGRKKLGKHA